MAATAAGATAAALSPQNLILNQVGKALNYDAPCPGLRRINTGGPIVTIGGNRYGQLVINLREHPHPEVWNLPDRVATAYQTAVQLVRSSIDPETHQGPFDAVVVEYNGSMPMQALGKLFYGEPALNPNVAETTFRARGDQPQWVSRTICLNPYKESSVPHTPFTRAGGNVLWIFGEGENMEVLLIEDQNRRGEWGAPGGATTPHKGFGGNAEDWEDAALRESTEEVGIPMTAAQLAQLSEQARLAHKAALRLFMTYQFRTPYGRAANGFFVGKVSAEQKEQMQIDPQEVAQARWIKVSDALRLAEEQKPILVENTARKARGEALQQLPGDLEIPKEIVAVLRQVANGQEGMQVIKQKNGNTVHVVTSNPPVRV